MLVALLMVASVSAQDPFHEAAWLTVPSQLSAIETANWIWPKTTDQAATAENAPSGTVVLTRDFEYAGENRVRLTFTCDNRCVVFLNDSEIGRSDDWRSPKTVMLQPRLGRNTLRVSATNDVADGAKNPGGFIAALEIGPRVVVSDSAWRSDNGEVVELGPASIDPWRLKGVNDEPSPIFRREFDSVAIARATLRVIGLGHYHAYINGQRIGEAAINQAWSEYDDRIFYQEFDVTASITGERNAIAFMLGNGFWQVSQPPGNRAVKGDAMPDFSKGKPYLLRYSLELVDKSGAKRTITSGSETKWTHGPVTLSHIYAG